MSGARGKLPVDRHFDCMKRCPAGCSEVCERLAFRELISTLDTIAAVLEAPRDRLGRLEFSGQDPQHRDARERLRALAVAYGVPGARDVMEQAAGVARAMLRRAGFPDAAARKPGV